ncbi:MAG: quinolinate synthase NadA [Dehalococcoidia bacterium]|nr:quinolinate synthase NadA [Dehalococcoidia bacterium]
MSNTTDIIQSINSIKWQRRAVILAHNYQPGEVQDIADFVGDSLELSQQAAQVQADVIVFCGVHFMAETANILSPHKTILLPDPTAGCPMADMINADALRTKKQDLLGVPVVCYVNSSAAVKAESDICCTSANAIKVVESLPQQEILFVPDQYLGQWVASQTGKKLHLWTGSCPTHANILPQHILEMKKRYPNAKVMVHPECRPEVDALADAIPSTSGMLRYAKQIEARQIIVGTEISLLHRLQKEIPDKEFLPINPQAVCPNMKLTTLDKILHCLEELQPQVIVPEEIRIRAYAAVERMLQVV